MADLKMTPTRIAVLRAVAAGIVSESRDGARRLRGRIEEGHDPFLSLDQRLYELKVAKLVELAEEPPQWGNYRINLQPTDAGGQVLADLDAKGK